MWDLNIGVTFALSHSAGTQASLSDLLYSEQSDVQSSLQHSINNTGGMLSGPVALHISECFITPSISLSDNCMLHKLETGML